jgi:hypothetical protein
MNELDTLKEFNLQLQFHFSLQDERIKKLEEAIKTHQAEIKNHWTNLNIDERQIPDFDMNKKLWECL